MIVLHNSHGLLLDELLNLLVCLNLLQRLRVLKLGNPIVELLQVILCLNLDLSCALDKLIKLSSACLHEVSGRSLQMGELLWL